MKKNYDVLYKYVYSLLENFTPLRYDCGTLCNKNCCGGDSETGMLLFPFEKTKFRVVEKNGRRIAVCKGKCSRAERPLSCRLFPFFPSVDKDGKIKVIIDSRGYGICPLVGHKNEIVFSQRFLHRVGKVGKALAKDEACRAFLEEVSEEIRGEEKIVSLLLE